MKKNITLSLVGLLCVGALAPIAAQAAPLDTDAQIEFKSDENETGNIIKPDENDPDGDKEEIITLPGGNQGAGSLRIQYVPDLKFGSALGFTINAQEKAVQAIPYVNRQGATDYIAPFVQVTNNTGMVGPGTGWSLSVSATPFVGEKAGAADHVLTNAHIQLLGSKLTTTRGTTEIATNLVNKQDAPGIIPFDGTNKLTVMSTKAGQETNGRQISNVFDNSYLVDKKYAVNEEVAGVKFVKPAGETAREGYVYKSTLTWNLVSGL